jgi:hypothetical protein
MEHSKYGMQSILLCHTVWSCGNKGGVRYAEYIVVPHSKREFVFWGASCVSVIATNLNC